MHQLIVKLKIFITKLCFLKDGSKRKIKWQTCNFFGFLLLITFYFFYQKYEYGNLPIFKNDVRIEKIIKSKFPSDYDVTIKKGDLTGLGENFYIAYGNKSYVKKLFGIDWSEAESLDNFRDELNYPIVRIFYVEESGFLEYLPEFILELKIKELYTYKPIIINDDSNIDINNSNTIKFMKNEYKKSFSGTSIFYLSDLKISDVDNDNKDEIIATWISYAGGSGGTKFSTIIEFLDGYIKLSSGYPDFIDYHFSSIYYAILKSTGMIPNSKYNHIELKKKIKKFSSDYINENIDDYHLFENKKIFEDDIWTLNKLYFSKYPSTDVVFYNIANEDKIEKNTIFYRHTDIYSNFIKYENQTVFVEAFYLDDNECHWCEHEWMLLSYVYKDGRWLSDRNINENGLNAQFLNLKKRYTLHQIHGTYELPGNITGLAWNFISPDWNSPALHNVSDPRGIGMIKKSPVIEYMDKIYK